MSNIMLYADWGQPFGYVRFNAEETGMINAKQHMFLFYDSTRNGF
jgi:hypothetical protein